MLLSYPTFPCSLPRGRSLSQTAAAAKHPNTRYERPARGFGCAPRSARARVMWRSVPHRGASRYPAADGQVPPGGAGRVRRAGWGTVAPLP